MTQLQRLKRQRGDIHQIAKQHGGMNIRVFGSVIRGEDSQDSDIDFLVCLEPGRTYFDFVRLKRELEKYLGCPIDLVLESAIKPMLRDEILRTAKTL